jgi:hypothetical protein
MVQFVTVPRLRWLAVQCKIRGRRPRRTAGDKHGLCSDS